MVKAKIQIPEIIFSFINLFCDGVIAFAFAPDDKNNTHLRIIQYFLIILQQKVFNTLSTQWKKIVFRKDSH